jgi:hypothetical protein
MQEVGVDGFREDCKPPAPARYDIAPDPLDHFIDVIGDIVRLTGLFSKSCAS